jgi:type II secretion system (T2SS) protein E
VGRKLGELLVEEGRISQGVLTRALQLQGTQARGLRLGAILLRWGLLPEKALLDALAIHHRCPAVEWKTLSAASPEALKLLPPAHAIRLGAVPFSADRKTIHVALANPSNLAALDEIAAIARRRVIASVTTEVRLRQAQQIFYKRPLDRDMWTIVQKIERPAAPPPPVAPPPPATIETSAQSPDVGSDTIGVGSDTVDLAAPTSQPQIEVPRFPQLPEQMEETEVEDLDEPAAAVAGAKDFEVLDGVLEDLPLAEVLAERLDPFSDDTPLAEFIEQALSFYEAHPTFQLALNSLDDGPIEDLDLAAEEEISPADTTALDSTQPSGRGRKRESDAQLIL